MKVVKLLKPVFTFTIGTVMYHLKLKTSSSVLSDMASI